MISWHDDIVDDIARRRSVLFLGSGISKNSTNATGARPKDWKEFLEAALVRITNKRGIKKLIQNGDYLTACELIKKELGKDDFNSFLKNEFLTPKFLHSEVHEYIYNLDSRIVATPNFDKIYDIYAESASSGNISIKTYQDDDIADLIRRPQPIILKIHGTITSTDKLIFSRKDYAKARIKHRDFYRILDALAITHTFIFLGCGVNDPDIRLLLEDYTYRFDFAKKHFIVMPKNQVNQSILDIIEETMNLRIVLYDPKNHHDELKSSLRELVNKVDIKRQELAASLTW